MECSSVDETVTSFPDTLSKTDESNFIKIIDGNIATYDQYDTNIDERFAVGSVRSSKPIPLTCKMTMYYFEMTVIHAGERGAIGIGLTGKGRKLNSMP